MNSASNSPHSLSNPAFHSLHVSSQTISPLTLCALSTALLLPPLLCLPYLLKGVTESKGKASLPLLLQPKMTEQEVRESKQQVKQWAAQLCMYYFCLKIQCDQNRSVRLKVI